MMPGGHEEVKAGSGGGIWAGVAREEKQQIE